MYKVFAYIGSYRGETSYSIQVTNILLEYLKKELNEEIEVKKYTPDKVVINECRGCTDCFITGKCPINDDMNEIKKNMIDSDIVIFSSPVYLHQISGSTKTFIDRISHWTHTLELRGKLGIGINVSDTNGNQFVEDYFEKVMSSLGLVIMKNISIQRGVINEQSAIESILKIFSKQIANSIKNKSFNSSAVQEMYFQSMKTAMKNKPDNDFEKKYWIENGMINSESFKSLFNNNCKFIDS